MKFYVIGEPTPAPQPARSLALQAGRAASNFDRERSDYPGLDAVLSRAKEMVKTWRADPRLRALALRITEGLDADFSGNPNRRRPHAVAQAVYDWVTSTVAYVKDPFDVEQLQDPFVTITSGAGDCDDHVVLVCSLLQALGIPCRFLVVRQRGSEEFNHILSEYLAGGEWHPLDTTEPGGAGDELPRDTFAETKTVGFGLSGLAGQMGKQQESGPAHVDFARTALLGVGTIIGAKIAGLFD